MFFYHSTFTISANLKDLVLQSFDLNVVAQFESALASAISNILL